MCISAGLKSERTNSSARVHNMALLFFVYWFLVCSLQPRFPTAFSIIQSNFMMTWVTCPYDVAGRKKIARVLNMAYHVSLEGVSDDFGKAIFMFGYVASIRLDVFYFDVQSCMFVAARCLQGAILCAAFLDDA